MGDHPRQRPPTHGNDAPLDDPYGPHHEPPSEPISDTCTCTVAIKPCGRPSCAGTGGSECCGVLRNPTSKTKDVLETVYDLTVGAGCRILGGLMVIKPAEGLYAKKLASGKTVKMKTVNTIRIAPQQGCNIQPWDLKDAAKDYVPVGKYTITISVTIQRGEEAEVTCSDSRDVDVFSCEAVGQAFADLAKKYGRYDRRRWYLERLLIPVSNTCICQPAMKNLEDETAAPFEDPCLVLCVNKELDTRLRAQFGDKNSCLEKAYKKYGERLRTDVYFMDVGLCENEVRAQALVACGVTKFALADKVTLSACIQDIVTKFAVDEFGSAARIFGPSIRKFIDQTEKRAQELANK